MGGCSCKSPLIIRTTPRGLFGKVLANSPLALLASSVPSGVVSGPESGPDIEAAGAWPLLPKESAIGSSSSWALQQ